jgi:AmmeMemoRadiSam system protein B
VERQPAVAGQFYPGKAESLRKMLSELIPSPSSKCRALGIISPHAGYVYSGAIAGKTFAQVEIPNRVVILGPNHHGIGPAAAVYPSGAWMTPLGKVVIDSRLAQNILRICPGMTADEGAHRFEHSLEVQVPFIQTLASEAAIVPICLGHVPLPDLLAMGEALGNVLSEQGRGVLMVASSDMTHYEPGPVAREKDQRALDRILALDPSGLFRTVREENISMCGVIPVVVMLAAAKQLGATRATLVHYGNSGDVTGDQSQVVGYAGVIVE